MDLSGQSLGKYKLIRRLGKGGMAQVYLANQPTIERQVAIKVLHRHLAENEDFILRFKREARSLGQLQHPNIVKIIDFDHHKDVYFMVMDFIAGPTLRTYLDEKKILSNAEALTITAQLVAGLAYAHQIGAVHRDIKPANVMFTDETCQMAVITDFGITKLINDQTITLEGSMVGTPAYMSPEAVIGERVDGRTDIYSLGVILYEMVTGRTPYEGATPLSLVVKQVHEPLPSPLTFRPDLPLPLVQLIEQALSKEINGRFQTAPEFLAAIEKTQTSLAQPPAEPTLEEATLPALTKINPAAEPATVMAQKESAPPITPPSPKKQLNLPLMGGALLLLVLIVAAIGFSRNRTITAVEPEATTGPVVEIAATPTAPKSGEPEQTAVADEPLVENTPQPLIETPPPTATEVVPTPPEPTPEAVPLLAIEANRSGTLQILSPQVGRLRAIRLQVERVPIPPEGMHYELWFIDANGSPQNIGPLPFSNNRLTFEGSFEQNILANFGQLLITLENNDAVDTTAPATAVFNGTLPAELQASLQLLLAESANGRLPLAFSQAAVTQQHFQFALDALANRDLATTKQHLEHVVNSLDGDSGTFFGDLNLDGQIQNPGDGVGVRAYLEQSIDLLRQIGAREPLTAERQFWVGEGVTAVESTLITLNTILQRASAASAADTPDEAEPIVNEVAQLFEQFILQNTAAYDQAIILAQIPIISLNEQLPAPDALVGALPAQFGLLELSNGRNSFATQYRLRMAQITAPPAGQIYQAWLINSAANQTRSLGQLNLNRGQAELVGELEANILRTSDQIAISLENGTAPNDVLGDSIIFKGQIETPISVTVLRLLNPDVAGGKGALFGIEEQLALAVQHHGFAQNELTAGNLAGAKIHAEHVVNILDGRSGTFFGDLNGDGQAQNPGDDVGIRTYWTQVADSLSTVEPVTGNQQFILDQLRVITQNNLSEITFTLEQASKVFASDTVAEAQPFLETVQAQLMILVNGRDLNASTTIDPLTGEGGLSITKAFIVQLTEVPLIQE